MVVRISKSLICLFCFERVSKPTFGRARHLPILKYALEPVSKLGGRGSCRAEDAANPGSAGASPSQKTVLKYALFTLAAIQISCVVTGKAIADSPRLQQIVASDKIATLGWIAFSGPSGTGDWDLIRMRADGSERQAITETPDWNEAGIRFSPDGRKMLYYRMPREEPVDNNTYGTWELVIANANGSQPIVLGRDHPWASWSPDSQQIAILQPRGIQILDLATRKIIREMPRRGIVQQLIWSPDGRFFVGTANGLGPYWNVARIELATGQIQVLSETERYNCTPDWMPDSQHVLYARGIIPEQPGAAELWSVDIRTGQRQVLYAERNRNLYGGCASPDGQWLLFTRSVKDLGPPEIAEIRLTLAHREELERRGAGHEKPTIATDSPQQATLVDLGIGWEPHWTFAEIAPRINAVP